MGKQGGCFACEGKGFFFAPRFLAHSPSSSLSIDKCFPFLTKNQQSRPTVCYGQVTGTNISKKTKPPLNRRNKQDKFTDNFTNLCFLTNMKEINDFSSNISNGQKILLYFHLIFAQMQDGGSQVHSCGLTTML